MIVCCSLKYRNKSVSLNVNIIHMLSQSVCTLFNLPTTDGAVDAVEDSLDGTKMEYATKGSVHESTAKTKIPNIN